MLSKFNVWCRYATLAKATKAIAKAAAKKKKAASSGGPWEEGGGGGEDDDDDESSDSDDATMAMASGADDMMGSLLKEGFDPDDQASHAKLSQHR